MNGQTNMDHGLIEYLLSALDVPEPFSPEVEGAAQSQKLASVLGNVNPHTAIEIRKFLDEMPGGFFIYQADGEENILYANKAMLRIFNCDTYKDFLMHTDHSFRGLVHPDDLEEVEESIREQIAHSQYDLDYVEYRIIQKGGEIRWVEDYGHFLHSDYAGNIFYVFAADATEKKQRQFQEKALLLNKKMEEEQQFQSRLEEYDREMKVIHQEHLRRLELIEGLSVEYESILYANLDANQILPYRLYSRSEHQFGKQFDTCPYDWYISDYVKTWVCPEDRARVTQATDPNYIRNKLSSVNSYYINYCVQKEEELQYLQLRIAAVGNKDHISRVVLGYRRVDGEIQHEMERKQLLEDALNHAKLSNIAKNTFLSNMSHDMRTPLNAITGYTVLAKNHLQDSVKAENYLQKIEASSEQLLCLINDVLDISRIESGTLQNVVSECNLSEPLQEIYDLVRPGAEAKNLMLTLDMSKLNHPCVYVDSGKLKKVLDCLCSNAVKFTDKGGQIRLSVSEQRDPTKNYAVYQFMVEDNGVGIDKEYLEHVFRPFERLKNTTQSGIHGTGLGLTIAKSLAELMGGAIQAESEPGKGSRFTITLTLRLQEIQELSPDDAEEQVLKILGERKILLVDDNEINLEIEAELLQDVGILVDTAMDGSEALERISQSDPGSYALILMDIQMPIMNGYEAAWAIRQLPDPILANTPIIALSSNAFEEDRRRSRESGMNAHMAKPAHLPDLLKLMAEILRPEAGS